MQRAAAPCAESPAGEAPCDLLPQEILAQDKRTFTLPWEEWLREPLRARMEAIFADPEPSLAAYLRSGGARLVWADFLGWKNQLVASLVSYVLTSVRRHLAA